MTREEMERLYDEDPSQLTGQQKLWIARQRSQALSSQPNFSPIQTLNQLVSGFISGLTALGDYADEPTNTWEAIANQIGHFGGFVGVIWPGKAVGRGVARAVGAIGRGFRGTGAKELGKTVLGAERIVERFRSVPMLAADAVTRRVSEGLRGGTGPAKLALGLLHDRPIMRQALAAGGHLGVASFVSELHEGVDDALSSGFHGMLMGGFLDAGLGNIPMLDGPTNMARAMRAIAGGVSNTVAPTLMGQNPFNAPIEMLVYDALLGTYFGWNAQNVKTWEATRYFYNKTRVPAKKGDPLPDIRSLIALESDPDFKATVQDPDVRRIVLEKARDFVEHQPAVTILRDVVFALSPELKKQAWDLEVRAGDRVRVEGEGATIYSIRDINTAANEARLHTGRKVNLDYLTPAREVDPELMNKREIRDSVVFGHDFEGFSRSAENKMADFLRNVARDENGKPTVPRMSVAEFYAHESNLMRTIKNLVKQKQLDPNLNDVFYFREAVRDFVHDRKLRPKDQVIKDEEFGPILDWYTEQLYSRPVNYRHYDSINRRVGKDSPDPQLGITRDMEGKGRQYQMVPPLWHGLVEDWGVITNVVQRDYRNEIVTRDFNQARLNLKDFGVMTRDLDADGYGVIGGAGEKTVLYFAKYAPKQELARVYAEMDKLSGDTGELDKIVTKSAERLGISKEIVRKNMANNALLYKKLQGNLPLEDTLGGEGRFIRSTLDWNKRLQILTQKYFPIHPLVLGESDRTFRYIYASDPEKKYDGLVFMRRGKMGAYSKAIGIDPGRTGALKFFYAETTPEGAQLWKTAGFGTSKQMDSAMEKLGVDMIVFDSAAKQTGKRNVYDMAIEPVSQALRFSRGGIPDAMPSIYTGDVSKLMMSRDIYDDVYRKLNRPRRQAKQLMDMIDDVGVVKAFADWTIGQSSEGTDEGNSIMRQYLAKRQTDKGEAQRFLRQNAEYIDEMNKSEVMSMLKEDDNFFSEFLRYQSRFKDDPEMEIENLIESESFMDTRSPMRDVERWLASGAFDKNMTFQKFAGDEVAHLIRKYFIDKRIRPMVRAASSARLAQMDPYMEAFYKVSDDKYYLGEEQKGLLIPGINLSGEKERMSLQTQWKLFEPLQQRLDQGQKLSAHEHELYDKMGDALETVIARMPIDNPSGILALKFGGFLPVEGGNMYISTRNMNRLGDADYDIDSAFMYFGFPKAYRSWVRSKVGMKESQFELFNGDPAETFFVDPATGDEIDKLHPLAMFDPYHMVEANRNTSIGRGENLPRSVAFKRRLSSLLIGMETSERGTPQEYHRAGDFMMALPRTREEKLLFEGLNAGAIRAAADAAAGGATKARVPLRHEEIRKIQIRSAFPELVVGNMKIYDRSINKLVDDPRVMGMDGINQAKRLSQLPPLNDAMMDIVAGKRIYPYNAQQGLMTRGEGVKASRWREYYQERGSQIDGIRIGSKNAPMWSGRNLELLGRIPAFDSIPYMAKWIELNSKWYRNDYKKPWTFDAINKATYDFIGTDAQHEPFWHLANAVRDIDWSESSMHNLMATSRAKESFTTWAQFVKRMDAFEHFFPIRLAIPNKGLNQRIKVMQGFSEDLSTPEKRRALASWGSDEVFRGLLTGMQYSYKHWSKQPLEAYIDWIEGKIKDDEGKKRQDPHKIRFDPLNPQMSADVVRGRMGFLESELQKTNHFISERISTLASIRSLRDLIFEMDVPAEAFNQALKKQYQLPTAIPGQMTPTPLSLTDLTLDIKRWWNKSRTRDPESGELQTMDKLNILIENGKWVANQVAKDLGVSPLTMREVFDTLLLSPIQGKSKVEDPTKDAPIWTGESRLGLTYASDTALRRYAKNWNEAYTVWRDGSRESDIQAFFNREDQGLDADRRRIFQRVIWPRDATPSEYTPEQMELKGRLEKYLSDPNGPFFSNPDAFIKILLDSQGLAQPSDMTIHDLRGMVNTLREWKHGPTFLNYIFNLDDPRSNFLWTIMFPDTLARSDLWKDFKMLHVGMLGPEGATDKYATPKYYRDPKTGELGAYRDSWTFSSTMQDAIAVGNYTNQSKTTEQRRVSEAMDEVKAYVTAINTTTKSDKDGWLLFDYGWLERELGGLERTKGDWVHDQSTEGKAQQWLHEYITDPEVGERSKWMKDHSHLLKQKFTVKIGGVTEVLTGEELAGRIQDWFARQVDKGHGGLGDSIFLTHEWLTKYGRFDPDYYKRVGMIDLDGVLEATGQWKRVQSEHIDFPAEYADLAQYLQYVKSAAQARLLDEPRSRDDILKWKTPYLRQYIDEATKLGLVGKTPTEINKWMGVIFSNKESVTPKELEIAQAWYNYSRGDDVAKGKLRYHPYDWRLLFFGRTRDEQVNNMRQSGGGRSMLESDMALVNKELSYNEWAQHFYLSAHPYLLKRGIEGYLPHSMHDPAKVLPWIDKQKLIIAGRPERDSNGNIVMVGGTAKTPEELRKGLAALDRIYSGILGYETMFMEDPTTDLQADQIMKQKGPNYFLPMISQIASNSTHMMRRLANVPGYSRTPLAIEMYHIDTIENKYKKMQAIAYQNLLDEHARRMIPLVQQNKLTQQQVDAMQHQLRLYMRQAMDLPSIFNKQELDDPVMALKRTPYYALSDHAFLSLGTRAQKIIRWLLRMDKVTEGERHIWDLTDNKEVRQWQNLKASMHSTLTEGVKRGEFTPEDRKNVAIASNILRRFAQWEARYELSSLLASLKSSFANLGGGNVHTIVMHGYKNWNDARKWETWAGLQGVPKRADGSPAWRSMADVRRWVEDLGVIQDIVLQDAQLRQLYASPQAQGFLIDAIRAIKKDPDMPDTSLMDIARKHGLDKRFFETAGKFMRVTERINREHAFLTGVLAGHRSLDPLMNKDLNMPYLIDIGRKTVGMTQFLYDNVNRPLFTTTNLGHVFGRFKIWAWSSARFQRELFNEAAKRGFAPNSPEFERLQRLILANVFMMGLASLLPYTIFDSTLPGPLSTLQNLADWSFGEETQRERAFYAQNNLIFKGWLAPVNELLPPITRLPSTLEQAFEWLFDPERELKDQYLVWSSVPFGRITRDVYNSINHPGMMPYFMTGLPFHRFEKLKNQ